MRARRRAAAVATLAVAALAALAAPAAADHAPVAEPADADCPGLAWMSWQGADAGTGAFHAGHVRGHADGDWARFRLTVARVDTVEPCAVVLRFDHLAQTAFALARGFDAVELAEPGPCAATVTARGHTGDAAPDQRWLRVDLGPGERCAAGVLARLAATAADGTAGASYFDGCTLEATATTGPWSATRCLEVVGAHGHAHCEGPVAEAFAEPGRHRIAWTGRDFAVGYVVYRAEGGGSFEHRALQGPASTEFLDPGIDPRRAYRYQVSALFEPATEGPACGTAEVAAIPDFPTPLAAGLALLGAALVAARRS